ncbi:MAG: NAD-dependent protein deacylase [Nitrosopumilaceae archaeon]|nr:NAD-dependent deacylase [Nitrosopumilaceae archaeon]NIU00867.1 NAD-dependent deacylase [Nitrosopumilaceae archaeon]NIU87320.1 NAD-dependent protein deacylase [Nitrosopumilaceae archaeon]NIV65848.1 NAD-dependent protein deacylase [Nitrosopumilaceae archaeon]NIX61469.1 NAD-dependent protein deacylase [Nitrosopumilaceae archaeon]
MFDKIKDRLKTANKISVVTGAGISQESGIPTFRGKDGLWKKHDPMKLATIEAFYEDPKLVWQWYQDRRENVFKSKPNSGHYAIADLEKFSEISVLTQNIDGLHRKAGSSNVYELHGSIIRIKCSNCNFKKDIKGPFSTLPPICECGGILRPDVVWFGELLPQDVWRQAIVQASKCDLMIITGTSLQVSPANTLPIYAKQNGAILIEVNPELTPMSSEVDLSIRASSSEALPKLVNTINKL